MANQPATTSDKSAGPETVEVNILDRAYKLVCSPDEKPMLMECAAMVDTRMRQVKQAGKLQSADRIAVMAALTLARELLAAGPGGGSASASGSTAEIKQRIKAMQALADQMLAPQETLFE
jgi:cell division protein ZapA